jgi:hypothetical protein
MIMLANAAQYGCNTGLEPGELEFACDVSFLGMSCLLSVALAHVLRKIEAIALLTPAKPHFDLTTAS